MKLYEKILISLFVVILLVSGYIRFAQVKNFNSALTYDQSRDLLDIRVLAGFHDFQISGPTTSITGLNLGPYYYFFNLPAFWLGRGNPQYLVGWNILFFLITSIVIFRFFYKKNFFLGFFISIFFLLAPQLFSITRYFWNANAVVYFIVFYFLGFWNYLDKKNNKSALIWGITSGLVIQFEAAFGSVCVAYSILLILLSKNKDIIKNFLFGLLPWFLPQLAFEIKHKFRMTKLFLGIFNGSNPILGDKVPFDQVLNLHINKIISYFEGQFMLPYGVGLIFIVLAFGLIFFNKKYRYYGKYYLGFLGFSIFFYTLIYHHELKSWYLEGIRVWYCFVIGMAIVCVTKYKKIFFELLTFFLIINFYKTIADQSVYIKNRDNSDDPKNTANLIKNIDWVYKEMKNEGFRAYNYVPEVYDYPHQYLYWWYGNKKYGYMPEIISYSLEKVPEYIRLQDIFYKNNKKGDDKLAIIYETKSTYLDWLNQFKDYCTIKKWETNWRTIVEIREKCL